MRCLHCMDYHDQWGWHYPATKYCWCRCHDKLLEVLVVLPAREPHEVTICVCGEVRPPGYGMCRVDACKVFKPVPFEG